MFYMRVYGTIIIWVKISGTVAGTDGYKILLKLTCRVPDLCLIKRPKSAMSLLNSGRSKSKVVRLNTVMCLVKQSFQWLPEVQTFDNLLGVNS